MKITLTILISMIYFVSFSQDQTQRHIQVKVPFAKGIDTIPFANASILLIANDLSKSDNLDLVKEVLPKMGINFIQDKKTPSELTTKLIPIHEAQPASGKYIIKIWCMDNRLRMICQDKSKRKNYDRQNGIVMFAKMKEVADQIGGKVYYTN
ncbi:hypothetical protein [Pedobacter agri]|uniref:hypothetical protein n=1 Tax=Pedobacter agri TaxID=454586 RepID=UPI0027D8882F|nr:hypothetical protein [Pedobacter agri]